MFVGIIRLWYRPDFLKPFMALEFDDATVERPMVMVGEKMLSGAGDL